jgi:hypothetical protein
MAGIQSINAIVFNFKPIRTDKTLSEVMQLILWYGE